MAGTQEARAFAASLSGIDADVVFDVGVADTLVSMCGIAAQLVEDGAGFRSMWATTALTDFRGHFSQVFCHNSQTEAADATELGIRLRELAQGATRLKEEAQKEQQRRETARVWKFSYDHRRDIGPGPGTVDWTEPPIGPAAEPPTITVQAVTTPRQTPAPGGGGKGGGHGGGGTSSAIPANLHLFATGSAGLNDGLRAKPAALASMLEVFAALCRWGELDGSGVVLGFARWVVANDQDVAWADTLAQAFAAAGGVGEVCTVSNSALQSALQERHIAVDRSDLVIDPAQSYGFPPTTGYTVDPVNTGTGNFLEQETDLGFPEASSRLIWSRCYNSFDTTDGAFGRGWSSLADAGLRFDPANGLARFRQADGRVLIFARLGSGWDRAVGESYWLEATDDEWLITGNDGRWWCCDAAGSLLCFGSGPVDDGDVVFLDHDQHGRLAGARHARGRSLKVVWNAGRIVGVVTSDGRRVDYAYDQHRLLGAHTPTGQRMYGWTDDLVTTVVDADGVIEAENVYDTSGRVVAQRSPHGRWTRLAYLTNGVTVVSDPDGERSNTWLSDRHGRLVGVVDADEARQSMSYDRYGNQVSTTERDGATTVHVYDARGRRTRTVTAAGAELEWVYDHLDRVTAVMADGAATTYAYDGGQRNPVTVTDPEGGLTRLMWRSGLVTSVIDPVGVRVEFGYDTYGDLVSVTDADGRVARTERDGQGRVTASVTPLGHRTVVGYDPQGRPATRTGPDGAIWSFKHTAAGRLLATVDPLGARTRVELGKHGDEVATVDPLGRTMRRTVDDLGRLSAAILPNGSSWQFAYDALSRLTASTDPTGATWRNCYDDNGLLVAKIDPTGVRQSAGGDDRTVRVGDGETQLSLGLDPLGRVTSTVQPDGSAEMVVYDRCGRPVESLDADGGLTRIVRDAAGRVVESVSPLGAVTRFGYNSCGRLASVSDPLGATTTIGYDADARPVEQVLPTGERAWTRYDSCGRVLEQHQPGVGTTTYSYDACGRVVETRDPGSGRRRFDYDAVGQLVTITDGNGGVTRYGYDELGRVVSITTPVGGVTRRAYDGMNRCVAETDPLGRTTSAGYDAAGRIAWQTDPDGHTTNWAYDAAGRPLSMAVDGRTVSTLARDLRNRRLVITDTIDDRPVEHVLEWNRRGQLVRRSRGERAVSWSYDADGRRTSMTTPDGKTTRYGCDDAGRLAWIEHPDTGRASFDRDAAGRVTSAVAGGILQSWEHRDGFVVGHLIADGTGVQRTEIERDRSGRVQAVIRDGSRTVYVYDEACQLIGAGSKTWRYDAGGRLISERSPDLTVDHVYDLAGQLLESRDHRGDRIFYRYDGLGRRIGQVGSDGVREFSWSVTGHLAEIFDRRGDQVSRRRMQTDALGELAAVDGEELFWDSAAYAGAPVLVGDTSVVAGGAVTGIGGDWTAPGWRTARSAGADPWDVVSSGAAAGVSIGASGEVQIAGLEWMGARAYDPRSCGFLSVDPLDPVAGAGWSANPYAYAGNDPLHALDPLGLTPVTDADLDAYGATMNRGGRWIAANGEYVVGGGMVAGGLLLCATGLGGPLGMMSISAGADTIIQKATTGTVDWREVALMGASGGIGFGAGVGAKAIFGTALRGKLLASLAAGVTDGGVSGGGAYLLKPGPHTGGGLSRAIASGAVASAAMTLLPFGSSFRIARRMGTPAPMSSLRAAILATVPGNYDSALASGVGVRFSATATAIGEDPLTYQNFIRSIGANGYHDLIVHGDALGWPRVELPDGRWLQTNVSQVIEALSTNPAYKQGQNIRLVQCYGGRHAAPLIMDALNVEVLSELWKVDLDPGTRVLRILPER